MTFKSKFLSRFTVALAFGGLVFAGYVISNGMKTDKVKLAQTTPAAAPESISIIDNNKSTKLLSIGGTGLIEPESEAISIGTNISGVVSLVSVKPGQKIKKGDILFQIDDRDQKAILNGAKADIVIAESKLQQSIAEIAIAKAKEISASSLVEEGIAEFNNYNEVLKRDQKLFERNSVSVEQLNILKFKVAEAKSKVKDYEARLEQAKDEKLMLQTDKGDGPTMILHKSELERAKIQAESEQIKLDLYRIKSPIDGTVLKVNVRAGEFAQAALLSTPLMVVGDIDPLHVRVEVDESEIHRFQSDKPAVASPRGQSQLKINLRFIRSEPLVVPKQVITGSTTERIDTRVLQVIYAIEDKVNGLSPGQQLDVFIRTTAE